MTGATRPSPSLVRTGLLVSTAFTLLVGCGEEGEVVTTQDATVLVSEQTNGGFAALGGGRLELVGGCLGTDGVVIVWPHGTKVVKDDPLTIDIPDQGTYALGDDVELGGGFVLERSSDKVKPGDYEVAGISVPAECAKHDIFLAH